MAAFPPGQEPPADALSHPHAQRWIRDSGDELGVGWEEEGQLRGAAWARCVEPVLVRDPRTGAPWPEVILAVSPGSRGAGVGTELMTALLLRARAAGSPGLSLSVSERNPVAARLYQRVGFVRLGPAEAGLVLMAWRG